jgi:spermidine synthase
VQAAHPVVPTHVTNRSTLLATLALFVASGAAALIYQVVWFQWLTLWIGASALSLGVVLATFLGGMCIGSLWLPRFVSAHAEPLRVYGWIELSIAACGIAALALIPLSGGVYTEWAGTGLASLPLRLLVAAVSLLPATILMGASLPAVARFVQAQPHGVSWLGFCYAANIGGAVVGSLAAGFYLLRVHDGYVATFVAVALNVGAGLVGLRLAGRVGQREPATAAAPAAPVPAAPPAASGSIYLVTALSGMTALSAEVLWTRHLSLLLGGTVYAFALILAVFLLGLGLGSAGGAALGRRVQQPRLALGACQLLLSAAMGWAAYAIARSLPYWPLDVTLPAVAEVALQLDVLRTAWAVLPAALLWGASFPLALAAAASPGSDPRLLVGRLYAANTAGAIVGALLTTFVLVVAIGSQHTQQLAMLVAAGAGLWLLRGALRHGTSSASGLAASAVVAAGLVYAVPPLPAAFVAYGRFLPTRGVDANVIYVGEGLTASIAVTQEPSGVLTYHNAGKTQASTYPQDLRLQRMLGHLSTLVPAEPKSVLVIGLGAGITAGAVSIDPAVERVVVAEIEPLVRQVAARYFAEHNFGVVTNPKVEIVSDDGRHYLATTDEKFDAITSDPLDPWVKGAATLYTREFWQLCKARLNDDGVVTVFLQLYESTDAAVQSEIATFFDVFPQGALFANLVEGQGYDAVLLARAGDAPIDIELVTRRLDSTAYTSVAHSLRQVGFESALDLLGTYAGRADDMTPWLDGAAINTDRNLRLQYLAGLGLNAYRAGEIFAALTPSGVRFPQGLFVGAPAQLEELRQRLRARQGTY